MILVAIGLFIAGSALAAAAPNMTMLILGRGLQGIGGGGILPLCQSVIADVVAPRERGRYQAYMGVVWVTSGVGGPVFGGMMAEHLHWSLIFWINVPLGARRGAAHPHLSQAHPAPRPPPQARRARRRADDGVVHSAPAGADLGRHAATVAVVADPRADRAPRSCCRCCSAGGLRRASEPFLPLTVLNNPVMRMGTASASLAMGVSIGLTIVVPMYFEVVHQLSATESGIALIPLALTTPGSLLVRPGDAVLEALQARAGDRACLRAGGAGVPDLAAGHAARLCRSLLMSVVGTAIGLVYPVTTVSIQNAVPHHQVGIAMGALNFFRSLASAFVVAVLGAILLAGLGVAAGRGGRAVSVIETVSAAGAERRRWCSAGCSWRPSCSWR